MCTLGLSSYIWLATHLILKLMLIVLSELQTLGERLLVTYIHFSSIYFCVCSMISSTDQQYFQDLSLFQKFFLR